jgi:hypothetical protein
MVIIGEGGFDVDYYILLESMYLTPALFTALAKEPHAP